MRSQFFACWSPLFGTDKNRRRQAAVWVNYCAIWNVFTSFQLFLTGDDDDEKRKTCPALTFIKTFTLNLIFCICWVILRRFFMLTQSLPPTLWLTSSSWHFFRMIFYFSHGIHPCVISPSTHTESFLHERAKLHRIVPSATDVALRLDEENLMKKFEMLRSFFN